MEIHILVFGNMNEDIKRLYSFLNMYSNMHNHKIIIKITSNPIFLSTYFSYDVIFLNIQHKKTTKFKIVKKLKEIYPNIKIVIISSYDLYYKEAFKVHAFDYIITPILKKEIFQFMDDFIETNLNNKFITFKTVTNSLLKLNIENIIYFESCNRNSKVITKDSGEYIIKYKIRELSNLMKNYNFCIPHQSFIVNYVYINEITNTEIILINNISIPISQTKLKSLKNQISLLSNLKKK